MTRSVHLLVLAAAAEWKIQTNGLRNSFIHVNKYEFQTNNILFKKSYNTVLVFLNALSQVTSGLVVYG